MAKHNFRVGDIFEGSAIQLNRWLSPIWAAGGKIEINGKVATIIWLPEDEDDEPISSEETVVEETVVEETVVEEVSPEVEEVSPEVEEVSPEVEEVSPEVEEVSPEVAIAPYPEDLKPKITRGRRPKKVDEVN